MEVSCNCPRFAHLYTFSCSTCKTRRQNTSYSKEDGAPPLLKPCGGQERELYFSLGKIKPKARPESFWRVAQYSAEGCQTGAAVSGGISFTNHVSCRSVRKFGVDRSNDNWSSVKLRGSMKVVSARRNRT